MTPEEIDQMPAGPEMDHLIATEIFKARKPTFEQMEIIKAACYQFTHYGDVRFIETLLIEPLPQPNRDTGLEWTFLQPRQYSTRIDAAWLVVEKIRESKPYWTIGWYNYRGVEGWYIFENGQNGFISHGFGEAAPLAICRAALRAVQDF